MRSAWKKQLSSDTRKDKGEVWTTAKKGQRRDWENHLLSLYCLLDERQGANWTSRTNGRLFSVADNQTSFPCHCHSAREGEGKSNKGLGWKSNLLKTPDLSTVHLFPKRRNLPTGTDALFGAKHIKARMRRPLTKVWGLPGHPCKSPLPGHRDWRGPYAIHRPGRWRGSIAFCLRLLLWSVCACFRCFLTCCMKWNVPWLVYSRRYLG